MDHWLLLPLFIDEGKYIFAEHTDVTKNDPLGYPALKGFVNAAMNAWIFRKPIAIPTCWDCILGDAVRGAAASLLRRRDPRDAGTSSVTSLTALSFANTS